MENKIKEIFRKEFNSEVIEIKKIKGGFSHTMFEVIIDKEPRCLVIRFANNSSETFNLGKEKFVMDLLIKKNIPVPKIYSFSKDYIIMEKLKGGNLEKIWNYLSNEKKLNLVKEIGILMRKIHDIKFDKFGPIKDNGKIMEYISDFDFKNAGEKIDYSKFLRTFVFGLSNEFAKFLSYKDISPKFFLKLIEFLVFNIKSIDYQNKPVLIHGDFAPGHIFVEKNDKCRIEGIVDFEFAAAFSPEYDFIKLHRFGLFNDPDLKKALIDGYGNIDEQAVKIYRIFRDFQFAVVLFESGNKKKALEIIGDIGMKIGFNEIIIL